MICNIEPTLAPITFIGGGDTELEFEIYDEMNRPIDLRAYTCKFYLSRHGVNTLKPILDMTGTVSLTAPHNVFKVALSRADTLSLNGKFIYQITMIDNIQGGSRPVGQGYCVITRNINQGG